MRAQRSRNFKPIVVVNKDDIRLARDAIYQFLTDAEERVSDYDSRKISFSVKLKNGDTIITNSVEELFEIENLRKNPIEAIEIDGYAHPSASASLALENSRFAWRGGKLNVRGPVNASAKLEKTIENIFGGERPIAHFFGSTNPAVISVIFVIYIHAISGIPFIIIDSLSKKGGSEVASLSLGILGLFVVIPLFISSLVVQYIQINFIKRFVPNWGEGSIRFEKAIKICNYLLWTLPATIALKYIAF